MDAELKTKLAENGMEVTTSSPEDLQKLIARDIKVHAELVKAAGLVPLLAKFFSCGKRSTLTFPPPWSVGLVAASTGDVKAVSIASLQPVLTRNLREFSKVPLLKVEAWHD